MQPWHNRVVEEANLFNPAFCAVLIAQAADDFKKKVFQTMLVNAIFWTAQRESTT